MRRWRFFNIPCLVAVVLLLMAFAGYRYDVLGDDKAHNSYVRRIDTMGLIVLYPNYSSIDLVCGQMPSKNDKKVILFAEAAYTAKCLKKFSHANINGDHVSRGRRYVGTPTDWNTGAFVYYRDGWKFVYEQYDHELDSAAKEDGMGFAQEMLVYDGELKPTMRSDSNFHQFRALCSRHGSLCVIESDTVVTLGEFKQRLMAFDVSNAIYLDMGRGWNHAWYRDGDSIVELHPKTHRFCTNWITFYK